MLFMHERQEADCSCTLASAPEALAVAFLMHFVADAQQLPCASFASTSPAC